MTDQPTKGPRWTRKLGGDGTAHYLQDQQDPKNWAVLTGPNHEANAKLFIAAQHMPELVEAAKAYRECVNSCLAAMIGKYPPPFSRLETAEERLRAILAKIKCTMQQEK